MSFMLRKSISFVSNALFSQDRLCSAEVVFFTGLPLDFLSGGVQHACILEMQLGAPKTLL